MRVRNRKREYERRNAKMREERRPRLRWGRFSMEELAVIHAVLIKAPIAELPWNMHALRQTLISELVQVFDERNRAGRPDPNPVQSTPNHKTLSNRDPKLANQREGAMKLCPTCGLEHPDNIRTSHHPDGCTCGSTALHAPNGNNQGPHGCVWMQIVTSGDPYAAHGLLILQRKEAIRKLANQKQH